MSDEHVSRVLSIEEVERVLLASTADGAERVPDAELGRIVDWAHAARSDHMLLDAVLRGEARPRWPADAEGPSFEVHQRGPGADDPDGGSTG